MFQRQIFPCPRFHLKAREDFEEVKFVVGAETQSVNDGDTQNFHYENNIGGINLSLSFKDSEFGVYDVPNGAVIHEEEHHDEEHGEEEHEDEHEGHSEGPTLFKNDAKEYSRKIYGNISSL